jgi:hypothetical protein
VVVQTIRFEGERYVRTIGITRQSDAGKYTPRFDQLAASVTGK